MNTPRQRPLPLDQPAHLRGGGAAAVVQRRSRRTAPDPAGHQPPDQGAGRRPGRGAVQPRHAPCRAHAAPGSTLRHTVTQLLRPARPRGARRSAARRPAAASACRPSRRSPRCGCCRGWPLPERATRTSTSACRPPTRWPTSTTPSSTSRCATASPSAAPPVRRARCSARSSRRWSAAHLVEQVARRRRRRRWRSRPTWPATRCSRKTTTAQHLVPAQLAALAREHGLSRAGAAALAVPELHLPAGAGALAGQGVALARLALVHDPLERGELVEPFGGRAGSHAADAYWLIQLPLAPLRPELRAFVDWVRAEAARTRARAGRSTPRRRRLRSTSSRPAPMRRGIAAMPMSSSLTPGALALRCAAENRGRGRMKLYIGNKNYSSWSMRPVGADAPVRHPVRRGDGALRRLRARLGFKRRVAQRQRRPGVCRCWWTAAWRSGTRWRSPSTWPSVSATALWPRDPRDRARARSLCAEMHCGLLRAAQPLPA